jgi:selenocysteine lyase/cysteine desulfurase
VITVAAGFPTTVNPIIQNGAVPVFVDVELGSYAPTPETIAAAVTPRTKAVMIAHTLGIPFDVAAIRNICEEHNLWLIEDCCDALGGNAIILSCPSDYDGRRWRGAYEQPPTGTYCNLLPRLGTRLLL